MRRFATLSVAALAVVFALSYVVPAVGGPKAFTSANPVKLAKKALKRAKKADSRSKKALSTLSRNGGVLGANVQTVSSSTIPIPAGAISSGSVACPAGTVVISGGYALTGGEASAIFDRRSANGWTVGVDNLAAVATGETAQLTVDAQCVATASPSSGSRSVRSARADRLRDQRFLERYRASKER